MDVAKLNFQAGDASQVIFSNGNIESPTLTQDNSKKKG